MTNTSGARDVFRSVRRQFHKKGGQTPGYINDFIPTEPLTLTFGPMRGKGSVAHASGSALLLGSKILTGSPSYDQLMYQVTRMRITTGTSSMYFALTHSRYINPAGLAGTFDTPFEAARGQDFVIQDPFKPIYSLLPGTLRVYALGQGSSLSVGKGSASKYTGVGSGAASVVSFSMDLYAI